jgi:hypothetical protein
MSHESQAPFEEPAAGPGYEVRDTNVRTVITFMVVLLVIIAILQMGLWGLLRGLRNDKIPAFTRPDETPIAVVDQPAQPKEFGIDEQLRMLRSHESEVLAGKTPAGKSSSRTVLPIDQAIDLLADRGIPPIPGPPKTEAEVIGGSAGKKPGAPQ